MGRIHPEAERIYFSNNPDARGIVKPFLTCFDVTRAFTKTKGPDRLECMYLRPEPFIAELIGLERELLLAYAPYKEFQARTIRLHDAIVAEDRTRLDPTASIIISDDPRTTDAVAGYLAEDAERPPIVALSRDAISGISDANDVRALLTKYLFRRDLFALESPLRTDTTFFGRSELVSELVDRFRAGQNSGLFGLRRIGKTSVLHALARRLENANISGSVYMDVSNPGTYQLRWYELLQKIVESIAAPLSLERADRSKTRALTIKYDQKTAAQHFRHDIDHLAERLPGKKILLMMDEIEHITFGISPSQHWAEDFLPFWQTMRSIHQETRGKLAYIVAGVNPHIIETDRVAQHDNPLFSTTKAFYVGPFDAETTREMVRRIGKFMGLRFEESVYSHLTQEYGGHPFLVRQACSHLSRGIKDRPADVTEAHFKATQTAISLALEKNVRQVLNVLAIWYPDEYEMIRLLAHNDTETFVGYAQDSAEFTQHVEGYGLVTDARGTPSIRIGLVKRYLAKQHPKVNEADNKEPDSILAEISRRRNHIECLLRAIIREGLSFSEGPKAMNAALNCLQSDRKAILAQYSYHNLWQELYFLELSTILDAHYQVFQRRFRREKGEVMQWLTQINRCRADAHAKALHSDDLAFLRVCFRRMEELLEA